MHGKLTIFNEDYLVDLVNSLQVVGNPNQRFTSELLENRIDNGLLGNRVKTDCRFIQQDDWRVLEQNPRQGQPVAFPTRKAQARLINLGV